MKDRAEDKKLQTSFNQVKIYFKILSVAILVLKIILCTIET